MAARPMGGGAPSPLTPVVAVFLKAAILGTVVSQQASFQVCQFCILLSFYIIGISSLARKIVCLSHFFVMIFFNSV